MLFLVGHKLDTNVSSVNIEKKEVEQFMSNIPEIAAPIKLTAADVVQECLPDVLRAIRDEIKSGDLDKNEKLTYIGFFIQVAEMVDSGDTPHNQISESFYNN
jgi:hypothetical protein